MLKTTAAATRTGNSRALARGTSPNVRGAADYPIETATRK